jgi:NhaC family Na+:H+ antiporter
VYLIISVRNPIGGIDTEIIKSLEDTFSLSVLSFIPAVLMLILPLFKLAVTTSILISAASGVIIAYFVQGMPAVIILRSCIFGYEAADTGLGAILNGGGMISMLEVIVILIISCAYSGIFSLTGMMEPVYSVLERNCRRMGRFATCLLFGVSGTLLFCNQTITTLLSGEILAEPYRKTGGTMQELAIDMENSNIVAAGFVPWCLGCKVPLAFMGVGAGAVPYAVYLFLVPLCYLFTKRIWFEDKERGQRCRNSDTSTL